MAVTQHFIIELPPSSAVADEDSLVIQMDRAGAESLCRDLQEALGWTEDGLTPEALAFIRHAPKGFNEDEPVPTDRFEEVEQDATSKTPEEILAFIQASAAAEMKEEHGHHRTPPPTSGGGSGIGVTHLPS